MALCSAGSGVWVGQDGTGSSDTDCRTNTGTLRVRVCLRAGLCVDGRWDSSQCPTCCMSLPDFSCLSSCLLVSVCVCVCVSGVEPGAAHAQLHTGGPREGSQLRGLLHRCAPSRCAVRNQPIYSLLCFGWSRAQGSRLRLNGSLLLTARMLLGNLGCCLGTCTDGLRCVSGCKLRSPAGALMCFCVAVVGWMHVHRW